MFTVLVNKFNLSSSTLAYLYFVCISINHAAPLIYRNSGDGDEYKKKSMLKLKRPIFIFPMMITNFEIIKYCCAATITSERCALVRYVHCTARSLVASHRHTTKQSAFSTVIDDVSYCLVKNAYIPGLLPSSNCYVQKRMAQPRDPVLCERWKCNAAAAAIVHWATVWLKIIVIHTTSK